MPKRSQINFTHFKTVVYMFDFPMHDSIRGVFHDFIIIGQAFLHWYVFTLEFVRNCICSLIREEKRQAKVAWRFLSFG